MNSVTPTAGVVEGRPPLYAWYVVTVLMLGHLISFVDRFLMSLVVTPMKADLGLTDVQLGSLQGLAFALLYVVAGVPLGLLADRLDRRRLIAAGMVVWSLATAACGLSDSYGELFLARVAVGLGEAALVPAAMSLIGDYFDRRHIAGAVSVFLLGVTLGHTTAFVVGGAVLELLTPAGGLVLPAVGLLAPWKALFVLASGPGIILAMLVLTLRNPTRQGPPAAKGSVAAALRHIAGRRGAYALLIGSGCCAVVATQATAAWAPAYLNRTYGASAAEAGYLLGWAGLISGVAGNLMGGMLTNRLQARGARGAVLATMAVSLGLAFLLAWAAFWPSQLPVAVFGGALFGFTLSWCGPALLSGIQLLTPPEYRGATTALMMCVVTLLGVGFGPPLVGLLSDVLFPSPGGLGTALLSVCVSLTLLGVAIATLGRGVVQAAMDVGATAKHHP